MTTTRWMAALVAALFLFLALPAPSHAQVWRGSYALTFGLNDTTAVGMADSSAYVDTRKAQRIWLWLKPSRPCRVAIAVYEAGAVDSSAVVDPDSTKMAVWPWTGAREITSTIAPNDSLVMRETLLPTSVQAGSYELLWVFPADGTSKWGSPRGRWVALHSPLTGEWYTGTFTRIRVRVLSASGVVTWSGSRMRCVAW